MGGKIKKYTKIKRFKAKSNCIKDAIYIDDGYSGTDFNRPGFKRMMSAIAAGSVNCVIVKDLSRLGRDYIEAGRLIQKTFPAFHVRFIAVADKFDSQTADYHAKSLFLPMKNFINDSYCRDISRKVRSHQKAKREQGKFIGAFAPYGYQKSPEDKNKLCPDAYAAAVVRKIFAWQRQGMSSQAIAKRLNGLGILSPLEYKKSLGENFSTGFRANVAAKWSAVAVKRILANELYTGAMAQGKREKVNYKLKKTVEKPQEEWVRVEGTHEAIISRQDFEIAQSLLKVDTKAKAGSSYAHLFSGLLFCGDCKEPMFRRVNRYKGASAVYFICSTRNKGKGCSRHSILEEDLKAVALQVLQVYVPVFLDVCRQQEQLCQVEVSFEEVAQFQKELERIHKEKETYLGLGDGLLADFQSGLITKDDLENFSAIFNEQYKEREKAIERQKEMIEQLFYNGIESGIKLERLKEAMTLTALDRDALLCFVSRIEVYEGKKVYLQLRGKEEFHKMLACQEEGL